MPVRRLPSNPDLDHLKYQAKDLQRGHAAHDRGVAQRIREFHPRFNAASDEEIFAASLRLSDAQLAIAREYGFRSWARLKKHVESPALAERLYVPHHERIDDPVFRRAVDLLDAGDTNGLAQLLRLHPGLVHQRLDFEGWNYFRHPTLLEFIAENPVRHGSLPKNIVEVARVILDAGPDPASRNETLGLVATGRVPRECGVQRALIELLCEHGADADRAIQSAAFHGESDAVNALIDCGAQIDLTVAASLGRVEEARKLLRTADGTQRHLALAMASLRGQVEIVRILLEAGEDPNRYNPLAGHPHSTPLHQAALSGNRGLADLLLQFGASPDTRDLMWHGTPADWARHEGRTEMEAYLREREAGAKQ